MSIDLPWGNNWILIGGQRVQLTDPEMYDVMFTEYVAQALRKGFYILDLRI